MNDFDIISSFYTLFQGPGRNTGELFTNEAQFVFCGDREDTWTLNGRPEISELLGQKLPSNFRYEFLVTSKRKDSFEKNNIYTIKGQMKKSSVLCPRLRFTRNFMQIFVELKNFDGQAQNLINFTTFSYLAPNDEAPINYLTWSKQQTQMKQICSSFGSKEFTMNYSEVLSKTLPSKPNPPRNANLPKSYSKVASNNISAGDNLVQSSEMGSMEKLSQPKASEDGDKVENSTPVIYEDLNANSVEQVNEAMNEIAEGKVESSTNGCKDFTLVCGKRRTTKNIFANSKQEPKMNPKTNAAAYVTAPGTEDILFVAGLLSRNANENFLRENFGRFGLIKHVRVVTHEAGGYGFVHFGSKSSVNEVLACADAANHFTIGDRYVIVDYFKRKLCES